VDRGRDALQVAVVEAHDLGEPAGPPLQQLPLLVGVVAADVLPLPEPAPLHPAVVGQVLLHVLGLGVVLDEALGDEQRGAGALRVRREVAGPPVRRAEVRIVVLREVVGEALGVALLVGGVGLVALRVVG
jgi:hypothetical protein